MTDGTLTQATFATAAKQFLELSNKYQDSWELVQSPTWPPYLRKSVQQQLTRLTETTDVDDDLAEFEEVELEEDPSAAQVDTVTTDLYRFEYHVVYSISYQVPVLYFNVFKSDGTLLRLEEAWSGFTELAGESREQLRQTLTQMEHPALFKPFLGLHPCKTANVLRALPDSQNVIVSFLSIYGPYVNLELDPRYGLTSDKQNESGENE
ncbi:conserved hypothetical protein [Culex quinquefasciatus]|uniref:Ubiquitin-like-conjugating enzyme ATG10 n=1 Tax=Culex quinquefasciatus TaxID=7176 RepID=B0X8P7_CULQU|nr:conserved hypothetical protein [Culex quinquefasciatus]|eukprot:XP_001866019.1 conserved hypothetical protein [Culex quinquefasciatus]